jgi:hypothetical protein
MNQPELNIVNIEDASGPKGRRHEGTGKKQFLTMVQDHHLITLLLTEYTASGKTDSEFADYAAGKIGLPLGVIKDHTIKMRRDQFKIENNRTKPPTTADNAALTAAILAQGVRVTQLEERIALLEGWINTTFPNRSGKKAI